MYSKRVGKVGGPTYGGVVFDCEPLDIYQFSRMSDGMPIFQYVSNLSLLRALPNMLTLQITFWPDLMHNIYVADVEAIKVGQVSFPFPLKEGDQ